MTKGEAQNSVFLSYVWKNAYGGVNSETGDMNHLKK